MTRYIFHGGETGVSNDHNKAFYQEWVKDYDEHLTPRILLVYFARPKNTWNALRESDEVRFRKYTNNRQATFLIASDDVDTFKREVMSADIVYFRGGDPMKIVDIMEEIKEEFLRLIDGKVFVGSSAGVMFISDYARSAKRAWRKYLGLLPLNVFVHYSDAMNDDIRSLGKKDCDSKELLLLRETEFVVRTY